MKSVWCSPATERTLLRPYVATSAVHGTKTRVHPGHEKDDNGKLLEIVGNHYVSDNTNFVRFLFMFPVGVFHLFCFNRRPATLRRRHPLSLFQGSAHIILRLAISLCLITLLRLREETMPQGHATSIRSWRPRRARGNLRMAQIY